MLRRTLVLDRDPADVLAALVREPGAVLLDVPDPQCPITLVSCRPQAELRIDAFRDDENVIAAIARFVAETATLPDAFPAGSVVVALAYEVGGQTVGLPRMQRRPHPSGSPIAVARRYADWLAYDHRTRTWSSITPGDPPRWVREIATAPARPWRGPLAQGPLVPTMPKAAHLAAIRTVRDHLYAGDCYQVNFTQRFSAPLAAPAHVLFHRLARRHPVPFRGYLDLGRVQIVMNSPELFLRRRGADLETRPIKGTRPRGTTPADDAALAAALAWSEKDAAEHVMIVDLERNDLGRVCETGSIRVDVLGAIESHPTVHHMVSSVTGRCPSNLDLATLLQATFPGGSITGAPKKRTMEIIAELEPEARGIYCGALGLVHPHGDLQLALPIRTAVVADGHVHWHAGGGIVVDSDPEREWEEAWLKTAALRAALEDPCTSG